LIVQAHSINPQALSALYGTFVLRRQTVHACSTVFSCSSAKDQLTGSSVAIKKIMKPFSTPVLSKRTYRELKLLKHIQHENVGIKLMISIVDAIAHLTLV
jgi:serine/threonine protein kinase